MKPFPKAFLRIFAIWMLMLCLCGCSMIDSLEGMLSKYTGGGQQAEQQIGMPAELPEGFDPDSYFFGSDADNSVNADTEQGSDHLEYTAEEEQELYGIVVCDILNVRSGPGTDYEVTQTIELGDYLDIYSHEMRQGLPWAETQYGWVCLDYVLLTDPEIITGDYVGSHNGTIIVDTAIVRTGPGVHYEILAGVSYNQRIEFTTRCSNWVKYGNGWLWLEDVKVDGEDKTDLQRRGTVNGTDVNIRTGPDTDYAICGKVNTGDRVIIYEMVDRNGRRWGRCDDGWICMDYVILD